MGLIHRMNRDIPGVRNIGRPSPVTKYKDVTGSDSGLTDSAPYTNNVFTLATYSLDPPQDDESEAIIVHLNGVLQRPVVDYTYDSTSGSEKVTMKKSVATNGWLRVATGSEVSI
jgi:hypothetical protein